MNRAWALWEEEFLRRNYSKEGAAWCAERLRRSVKATGAWARRIGLKRREKKESLCWDCGKFATGQQEKCPWKWEDIPIPGWTTEPGTYGGINVVVCPEFKEWKR